jgi:twitching motility protein PilT
MEDQNHIKHDLMTIESLVLAANAQSASDLHLEPGRPAAVRVRGALHMVGEPIAGSTLFELAREMIGDEAWPHFLEQRSADFSRTCGGVRCRVNVMHTSHGVGFAIRLLASFQATIERLNLHPDLKKLASATQGLVLVSGATGSGKSSTMAALIHEINLAEPRHILTLESPIEYIFRARRAFIRQREVGRDTPSFEQGLLDALREDPDVVMVGEMREPETMRLTLNAAETGHLVFATVHSGTCAEALQRIVLAFPAEIQNNVAAQLADSLVAVVCQRLRFRSDLNLRVPECEILRSTNSVKAFIRNRDFFKIPQALETGADHGMWSFDRYQNWMNKRAQWHIPNAGDEAPDREETVPNDAVPATAPISQKTSKLPSTIGLPPSPTKPPGGRIEIEPVKGGMDELIKRLT